MKNINLAVSLSTIAVVFAGLAMTSGQTQTVPVEELTLLQGIGPTELIARYKPGPGSNNAYEANHAYSANDAYSANNAYGSSGSFEARPKSMQVAFAWLMGASSSKSAPQPKRANQAAQLN